MWKVASCNGYTHKGAESYVVGEPFAVTQEPSGQCRVWLKQELSPPPSNEESTIVYDEWDDGIRYTPEAQKVQDEAKERGKTYAPGAGHFAYNSPPRNAPFTKADMDCAIETARTQAIKDVAKFISLHCGYNNTSYVIHRVDVENFKKGMIPE